MATVPVALPSANASSIAAGPCLIERLRGDERRLVERRDVDRVAHRHLRGAGDDPVAALLLDRLRGRERDRLAAGLDLARVAGLAGAPRERDLRHAHARRLDRLREHDRLRVDRDLGSGASPTSGVISAWKRPPRCLAKNFSDAAQSAMLLTGRAKPWPSSGARMYSTGKPRSRSAITICSDSAFLTRGSLAPCTTSSGVLIFCAELSGDWRIELRLALRRLRVAHALVEDDAAGLPVGRDRVEQRDQVRGRRRSRRRRRRGRA